MRKVKEIGECPKCGCSIFIYKTNSYKRFAKCDACEASYAIPKSGAISISALDCPKEKYPILIVEKRDSQAYFWTDRPCFTCIEYDLCTPIKELLQEFKDLEVYGY